MTGRHKITSRREQIAQICRDHAVARLLVLRTEARAHLQGLCAVLVEVSPTRGYSLEAYLSDGLRPRAFERCIEITGEALVRIRSIGLPLLEAIPYAQQTIGMRYILPMSTAS